MMQYQAGAASNMLMEFFHGNQVITFRIEVGFKSCCILLVTDCRILKTTHSSNNLLAS